MKNFAKNKKNFQLDKDGDSPHLRATGGDSAA